MSLFLQALLDTHDELIVDLFAGGGGASSGIEQALGRMVDIAINHDAAAVSLHQANHPQTKHLVSDVFEVCPRTVTNGRPVGLLWASPDCTFHSKARGGKPIRSKTKKRRALAWVVTRWAGQVRPRVIMLENVEEFANWGPLIGSPDNLKPCPRRRGRTFRKWVNSLRRLGYVVEWRELRACDYGAPTIRKRLFLIARCDGQPIVWPEPTHGTGKKPYRTAAECIDWTVPMCSIFATREEAREWGKINSRPAPIRPLAENTMRRIARGVQRYVIDNLKPFIVTIAHGDKGPHSKRWGSGVRDIDLPVATMTGKGEMAVISPIIAGVGGRAGQSPERSGESPLGTITGKADAALVVANLSTYYGDKAGTDTRSETLEGPLATQTTENRHALVASFLAQHNGGFYEGDGRQLEEPLSTILTESRGHHGLIAASLTEFGQNSKGSAADEPLDTVMAGAPRHGLVASFLSKYNGTGIGQNVDRPADTITSKDRLGLVTVQQIQYVIADIAMRMLQPRELYNCQGFRPTYIIDRGADGRVLTKTEQVRMVGNSVCPPMAEALVRANVADLIVRRAA